jgi:hypothetical protein
MVDAWYRSNGIDLTQINFPWKVSVQNWLKMCQAGARPPVVGATLAYGMTFLPVRRRG